MTRIAAAKLPSALNSLPVSPATSDFRILQLNTAVMEIRQACDEPRAEAHRSPFFFVVGAGISYPPVPLSASIITHCQSVAQRYNRADLPEGDQTLDAYSHWFSRAYPGARQRQQYLRKLIERKPLSLSSLRLAHLLSARKLTNLVVTTNFDDFIARALRLFGEEPAVCDHPRTVGRIDRERPDIQILHVHGSYLFYDCANLRVEVTGRARVDEETSFTMVGLLDSLLWNRSPLVIGYSGWEGDVIMSALKRRLRGGNPLAQSVYWFCYRRDDYMNLPSWLRDSPDMRFVVPPEPAPAPSTNVRTSADDPSGTRSPERPAEVTLDAFVVFDQFNRAFDISEPALFHNPIETFAKNLQAALPETEGPGGDPYGFKALIDRLHQASHAFGKVARPTRGLAANLERLRALMRESQYPEAVRLLAKIVPARLAKLTSDQQREVLQAADLAGNIIFSKTKNHETVEDLASVLVFDPKGEKMVGQLAEGTALATASRSNQMGYEMEIAGKIHGPFTYHLADTLRNPASDTNGDARISLIEATIAAGKRLMRLATPQIPTVAGDAAAVALFSSGKHVTAAQARGTVHALLVGVGKMAMKTTELFGPVNDVRRIAEMLHTRERRLFQNVVVTTLINKRATRAGIERELARINAAAKPQDLVLFYFSGHSTHRDIPKRAGGGQERLLVLYDFDQKDGGTVTLPGILERLQAMKAKQRVIILG